MKRIEIPIAKEDVAYMQMCDFEYAGLIALIRQFTTAQSSQMQINPELFNEILKRHDAAYAKYRLAQLEIARKYPLSGTGNSSVYETRIDYIKEAIIYELL